MLRNRLGIDMDLLIRLWLDIKPTQIIWIMYMCGGLWMDIRMRDSFNSRTIYLSTGVQACRYPLSDEHNSPGTFIKTTIVTLQKFLLLTQHTFFVYFLIFPFILLSVCSLICSLIHFTYTLKTSCLFLPGA